MKTFLHKADAFIALPLFGIVLLVMKYAKTHPWHRSPMTFDDWVANRTPTARMFDIAFWFSIFSLCLALTILFGADR